MTLKEMSDAFDTLLSSYQNHSQLGLDQSSVNITLDEYEKSLFLTEAQRQFVQTLYQSTASSFEQDERTRRQLANLIDTQTFTPSTPTKEVLTNKSYVIELPEELMFITYEQVKFNDTSLGCANGSTAVVQPVAQDQFYKIQQNPFRRADERGVLRLDLSSHEVEIVSKYDISEYQVRYLKYPEPIILIDLEGVEIEGLSTQNKCKLDDSTHDQILNLAVQLAIASRANASQK